MSHGPDWGLLALVNWLTAYAYFSISFRLRQRRLRRTHQHWTESVLFETFILACGTHHFVHPLAVLLNAWWLQFVADAVMASVSLLAERVVTRNSQREFA